MALTVFLMQWHEGTYRDAFLDYVRDAYRGRIKHGTGRSLQDRLGQPYATLDSQFLAFLKNGAERLRGKPGGRRPADPERSHPDRAQTVDLRHVRQTRAQAVPATRPARIHAAITRPRRSDHSPTYGISAMNRARLTAALAAR